MNFIGFYRCTSCGETIGGFATSNPLLLGDYGNEVLVDPRKIITSEWLQLLCIGCCGRTPEPPQGIARSCYQCKNDVHLFYFPPQIGVDIPDEGKSLLVATETLLVAGGGKIAFCDIPCFDKTMGKGRIEINPIFLDFKGRITENAAE